MNFCSVFQRKADAQACINGSCRYPDIRGVVRFYQLCGCVMVTAEVEGLPLGEKLCDKPVFAFHIHERAGTIIRIAAHILPMRGICRRCLVCAGRHFLRLRRIGSKCARYLAGR